MNAIHATVSKRRGCLRVLIQVDGQDVLIARLRSNQNAHRLALRTLLEAVALWHQQPVRVVVYADEQSDWQTTGLLDALGFGQETLHFSVDVVPYSDGTRAKRLTGLGEFADERRLLRSGGRR